MGEIQIVRKDILGEPEGQESRRQGCMIRSILSVGGIILFVAMFLYFMANPVIAFSLFKAGIGMILKIIWQFFSYLGGLATVK